MKILRRVLNKLKSLFISHHKLTVSYNSQWGDRDDTTYIVKKFTKLTDKHIKFIDINKKKIEIRSTTGLHYKIEEIGFNEVN